MPRKYLRMEYQVTRNIVRLRAFDVGSTVGRANAEEGLCKYIARELIAGRMALADLNTIKITEEDYEVSGVYVGLSLMMRTKTPTRMS